MGDPLTSYHLLSTDEDTEGASFEVSGDHCALFQFVVNTVIIGALCLCGFVGNTLSFITLWQDDNASAAVFLLQAVNIADFAVIWMLFIGDCLPALGYAVPLLQACAQVCGYVRAVTQPLLFLAQVCVVWFTALAVVNRYVFTCKPAHATLWCTLDFARKQVIVTVTSAVLLTLPLTFDSSVLLAYHRDNQTVVDTLANDHWYQVLYLDAASLLLVYVLPFLALAYFSLRLLRVLRTIRRLRRSLATEYKAQHMDMTQALLTLSITLLICYQPLVVLKAVEWANGRGADCGSLQLYLDSFAKMFMAINSSIKVVILCLFTKRFRQRMQENFVCSRHPGNKRKMERETESMYEGIYKCADMSEMTLISHVDSRL